MHHIAPYIFPPWFLGTRNHPLRGRDYPAVRCLVCVGMVAGILAWTVPANAAPTLHRLVFPTTVADVSSESATLPFSLDFSAPKGLASVEITLTSEDGDTFSANYSPELENLASGTFSGELEVPFARAPGPWRVAVELRDEEAWKDGPASYGRAGQPPLPTGSTTQLTVVNTGAVDREPPRLISATITPHPVSLAPGGRSFTVTLTATDDVAVEWVGIGFKSFYHENGAQNHVRAENHLVSGNKRSGTWLITIAAEEDEWFWEEVIAAGDWSMSYNLQDASGRSVDYDEAYDLPLPDAAQSLLTFTANGASDVYAVWRAAYPELAGSTGEPGADYDWDGLPNVVEFLCGTSPTLNSASLSTDDLAFRAPVVTATSTHLRMDYRLSASRATPGPANPFTLIPQTSTSLNGPWVSLTPTHLGGDRWRVEVPFSADPARFLRLAVLP